MVSPRLQLLRRCNRFAAFRFRSLRSTAQTVKVGTMLCQTRELGVERGFTLIELLVSLAIMSVLAGLILPAVQMAREAARRTTCGSHLKNMGLAILEFENARRQLPVGRAFSDGTDLSWSYSILPSLEGSGLFQQVDRRESWSSASNETAAMQVMAVFRCPSSRLDFPGDTDYAGLMGTALGHRPGQALFNRGVMIATFGNQRPITLASITDGTSNSLCLSENHDRPPPDGLWISGLNCISHDYGSVNARNDGIRSLHLGGAMAVRADGSVLFLPNELDEQTLGALLTRSGGEVVPDWFFP
jgi:prepilin-type N-terminal cleavage/methylation domain-containing protein